MSAIAWQRLAVSAASLVAILLSAPSAGAWNSSGKWAVNVVPYWINPSNHDVTDAQAISAMRFGADAWTKQTRAAFRFAYKGTTTISTAGLDDTNVVLFRDSGGTSHATAYTWRMGSTIVEGDIVFWDTPNAFIAGSMTCTQPQIYIENVSIHEFGHVLGLDHTTVTTATMYPTAPGCDKSRYTLDPDDIAGVEALYPCSTATQCNDANVCTTDACQNTKCIRTAISGCCTSNTQCNDSNPCTTDTCLSNKCSYTAVSGCCTTNTQCNDSNPCTTDKCVSNKCSYTAVSGCCTTNTQCNDSNPCTTDTCVSNKCSYTAVSGCCTTNTQCNDSNPCTTDTCVSNKCSFTAVADCCTTDAHCDDGNPCTTDECVNNGCTYASVNDCCFTDEHCDDGDPCTSDSCQELSCMHEVVTGCGQGDAGPDGSPTEAGSPDASGTLDASLAGDAGILHDAALDGGNDGSSPAKEEASQTDGGCAACAVRASPVGPEGTLGALFALAALALGRRARRR